MLVTEAQRWLAADESGVDNVSWSRGRNNGGCLAPVTAHQNRFATEMAERYSSSLVML